MRRHPLVTVASASYATTDLAVIVAPSVVLRRSGELAGIDRGHGLDLVVVSLVIGVVHASVSWWSLRRERHAAYRRTDAWIAAFFSLSVLALGPSLLLPMVLLGFVDQHMEMANRGYPVAALFAGVLVAAVVLAEVARRAMFAWLEPERGARARRAAEERTVDHGPASRPQPRCSAPQHLP